MFKSVTVKNFRAISELRVDGLGRVNLFVGHNAAGKTTLLEGIFFLIGATKPKLSVSVNTLRGFPDVHPAVWPTYFHSMNVDIPIEICAEEAESGWQQRLMIRPRYDHSPSEVASNGTPVTSVGDIVVRGLQFEYSTSEAPSATERSSVFVREDKLVDEGARTRLPSGTFVASLPVDVKDPFSHVQRKKRVHEVVSLLKEVEPAIEDLRLLDPPGQLYADTGAVELIPLNLMGGGISKLLNVALAMLNMQDGFVLMDEIENGLDYSSQRKLWDAVFGWAQKLNVQVFATTHSAECIKAFSDCADGSLFEADAKLFRIERKGDDFRAVEYSRELLAESLESNWEVR
jgi:energy-coupling factor transporter ATP-binding protein EcfA2